MSEKIEMIVSALQLYGLKETLGGHVNEEVTNMIEEVTGRVPAENKPWCSAFVGYILKINGYEYSQSLAARSYLNEGISTENPEIGDIVVFWRGSVDSWTGHVGFYIAEDDSVIYVLGGNQSNKVCIKSYSKKQLLGYRIPMATEV